MDGEAGLPTWARADVLLRALRESPIPTCVIDAQGHFVFANHAFSTRASMTEDELLTSDGIDLSHPVVGDGDGDSRIDSARSATGRLVKRFVLPGGQESIADLALAFVRDSDGAVLYVLAQIVDAPARDRELAELRERAERDPLTGLLNRRALAERIAAVPGREQRAGAYVAVLYCDLDGLKSINDKYGHHVGDAVLQAVGARIAASVRTADLVARVGGDEFVIVLTAVRDNDSTVAVAHKIAQAVSDDLMVEGIRFQPTLSIGIALTDDVNDVDQTLNRADAALYAMKRRGTTQSE